MNDWLKRCGVPAGYILAGQGSIHRLGADTALLRHQVSGAQVFCAANDDDELGFSISYRAPYLDETDANHALEHVILTASGKYPGKDIFFELTNKSFNTFVNAYTYPVVTSYPVCSQSGEQLRIMADVYLSCMTDPAVSRDVNIFKREALRCELRSQEEPIRLAGTVYGEDCGYLTDTSAEALNNMLHCLYPGLNAANGIGRAHLNYRELTWERAMEVYRGFYAFDNALIILYGNMDFGAMLRFLDEAYLSKAENTGRGEKALELLREAAEPGYLEKTFQCPAYEGDEGENVSIVEYGVDVSEYPQEDLFGIELLSDLLDHENSPFHRRLREEGIVNRAYCGLSSENAKNFFALGIENGEESQKDAFLRAVKGALEETARRGVDPEVIQAVVKDTELTDSLAREQTALAVEVTADIGVYWALTGRTDFYEMQDAAFERLKADAEQREIKRLAAELLNPRRSALVVTAPKPGLAEELEHRQEADLEAYKVQMTRAEREALIRETEEFDRWNEGEGEGAGRPGSNRFAIAPESMPKPEQRLTVQRKRLASGAESYGVPVKTEGAGVFRLLFRTGAIPQEKLHSLSLYAFLLMELPTQTHSVEQLKLFELEYLNRLSLHFAYPPEREGGSSCPLLSVRWYGLTQDFGRSLELLLGIMAETKFSDGDRIAEIIEKYMADFDLSRSGDLLDTAMDLANAGEDLWQRYELYMEGQEFYRYLKKTLSWLKTTPDAAKQLERELAETAELVLRGGAAYTMTAAAEEALPEILRTLEKTLAGPAAPGGGQKTEPAEDFTAKSTNRTGGCCYDCLKKPAAKTGICAETPDQHCACIGTADAETGFVGRYLPFLMAAEDKYLLPKLRFEGGAYDAGASFRIARKKICLYTSSDPNVRKTLEVFAGTADFVRGLELTQEELNSYILNAYSAAVRPRGELSRAMEAMSRELEGIDGKETAEIEADILLATPGDRDAAADWLEKLLVRSHLVTVGNEKKLAEAKDCFDELLDYRGEPDEDEEEGLS